MLTTIAPVTAVQATGGALRSPLWREVLAAVLDRPLRVAGDAEGTALGAAALGLVAIGRAGSPAEGLAMLSDPSAAPPQPVERMPDTVAAYAGVRASIAPLLVALGGVGALFADVPASRGTGTPLREGTAGDPPR